MLPQSGPGESILSRFMVNIGLGWPGWPTPQISESPQGLAGEGSRTLSVPAQNELGDSVCRSASPQASASSSAASGSAEPTPDEATRDEATHDMPSHDGQDQLTSGLEPNTSPSLTNQPCQPSLSPSLQGHITSSWRGKIWMSPQTWSRLGWIVGLFGLVAAVIALPPAFKSQYISRKVLDLALWTAKKDFIEQCKQAMDVKRTHQSAACEKALAAGLPPPPYVEFDIVSRALKKLGDLNNRLTPKDGYVLVDIAKRRAQVKLQTLQISHSSIEFLHEVSKSVLSGLRSLSLPDFINSLHKTSQASTQALESSEKRMEKSVVLIEYIRLGIIYTSQWVSHQTAGFARGVWRLLIASVLLLLSTAYQALRPSLILCISLWKWRLQILEVLLYLAGPPNIYQRNFTPFQIHFLASSIVVAINELFLQPGWCMDYCKSQKSRAVVSTAACFALCAYKDYRHSRPSVVYWGTIALGVEYGFTVLSAVSFHGLSFSLLGLMAGTAEILGIIYYYKKRRPLKTLRLVSTSLGILMARLFTIAYWEEIRQVLFYACVILWCVGYASCVVGFIVVLYIGI